MAPVVCSLASGAARKGGVYNGNLAGFEACVNSDPAQTRKTVFQQSYACEILESCSHAPHDTTTQLN